VEKAMILDLSDTTTSEISKQIVALRSAAV
jgi:hypothetical protein